MSDPTPQQITELAELLRCYEFDGVARGFPDVIDVLHRAADALESLSARLQAAEADATQGRLIVDELLEPDHETDIAAVRTAAIDWLTENWPDPAAVHSSGDTPAPRARFKSDDPESWDCIVPVSDDTPEPGPSKPSFDSQQIVDIIENVLLDIDFNYQTCREAAEKVASALAAVRSSDDTPEQEDAT